MKVNLRIEPAIGGGFFSKKQVHRLTADVQVTPEEQAAIQKAGIREAALITLPPPKSQGEFERNTRLGYAHGRATYCIGAFYRGPVTLDYDDIVQATQAKEELIKGLQGLKTVIKMASHGPQTDSFEL